MSSISSDTSGDESDQGQDKFSEDNAGVGRSYECTFCKRGFTNAQALGGHMNIHRKDKLKAKQACKQQESALSRKSKSNNTHNNDHEVCTQQISSQQQQEQQNFYYPSSRAYVTYHQFHFPSANPSYQFQVLDHHGYYRNFALHGGFGDANLSLRIGSPDDEERKEDIEVSEVDLELRLGPNSTFT